MTSSHRIRRERVDGSSHALQDEERGADAARQRKGRGQERWSAPSTSRRTRRRRTSSSRPAPTPSAEARRPSRRRASATCARSCRPPTRTTMCFIILWRAAVAGWRGEPAGGAESRGRGRRRQEVHGRHAQAGLRPAAVAAPEGRPAAHRDVAADVRLESRLTVLRHGSRRTRGLQAPERRGAFLHRRTRCSSPAGRSSNGEGRPAAWTTRPR